MIRTQHRMPVSSDQADADANELSPEQILSGVAMLIGFALATGLVYALIDAML
jgi:hypothetical protein